MSSIIFDPLRIHATLLELLVYIFSFNFLVPLYLIIFQLLQPMIHMFLNETQCRTQKYSMWNHEDYKNSIILFSMNLIYTSFIWLFKMNIIMKVFYRYVVILYHVSFIYNWTLSVLLKIKHRNFSLSCPNHSWNTISVCSSVTK